MFAVHPNDPEKKMVYHVIMKRSELEDIIQEECSTHPSFKPVRLAHKEFGEYYEIPKYLEGIVEFCGGEVPRDHTYSEGSIYFNTEAEIEKARKFALEEKMEL